MFRTLCAHHQEVKILLHSITPVDGRPVHRRPPTGVMIPDAV